MRPFHRFYVCLQNLQTSAKIFGHHQKYSNISKNLRTSSRIIQNSWLKGAPKNPSPFKLTTPAEATSGPLEEDTGRRKPVAMMMFSSNKVGSCWVQIPDSVGLKKAALQSHPQLAERVGHPEKQTWSSLIFHDAPWFSVELSRVSSQPPSPKTSLKSWNIHGNHLCMPLPTSIRHQSRDGHGQSNMYRIVMVNHRMWWLIIEFLCCSYNWQLM